MERKTFRSVSRLPTSSGRKLGSPATPTTKKTPLRVIDKLIPYAPQNIMHILKVNKCKKIKIKVYFYPQIAVCNLS